MFRFLMPTILLAIAVIGFLTFTQPILGDISNIKKETIAFNEALGNAKMLENERDKLTTKYNSIDPNNLLKLQKLLPDHADNIRLVLEIEKLASPYGMVLKDVKYDSKKKEESLTETSMGAGGLTSETEQNKSYGTWMLEFSTEGSYSNFINFLKDLESNLRIIDISTISFSSTENLNLTKPLPSNFYKYNLKIKTYWLKN